RTLVERQVNASDPRHLASPLALLVTLVLVDHQHHAIAADDLAFLAHRLDRRSYLHDPSRRLVSRDPALAAARAAATGSWTRANVLGRILRRTPDGSNSAPRSRRRRPAGRRPHAARRRPPLSGGWGAP